VQVLISGGGIAGPALAHWLHGYGIGVTVVERAPAPRPGGHAVDVRGVAKGVVERMGLMPAVLERRVDERGVAMVDDRGRRLAEMSADMFDGEGIIAEIEISRGDLGQVLYDATREFTDYRFGDRITALAQDDDGVKVTFLSGGTERFDAVIGADGVHSGVRALAFGPDRDYVRYLGGYTAYFTAPDPGDLGHWAHMINAPGGRVAVVRPERGGTVKAGLSFTHPDPSYARLSTEDQKRLLVERMSGAGGRVPSLLAAMPTAKDFFFDSIDQVRVEQWWRGRVALLGDAGYCGSPLAGLGTSMALTGAYVLAGELATHSDPSTAFAAYQQEMAAYVRSGLQMPPGGMAGFAPKSRLMIRLRGMSMRSMGRWPMRSILAKQFAKSDNIELKEYSVASAP
jgi:2-polyprenyl-6-methoxyphenol hydroxylase-like FAD-dependent oxidoreductase